MGTSSNSSTSEQARGDTAIEIVHVFRDRELLVRLQDVPREPAFANRERPSTRVKGLQREASLVHDEAIRERHSGSFFEFTTRE